ncbi:MAG TPA: hypothetical protein VJN43_15025 [Bryobacteraceae bacterium]|nr:hypothetical protein [Bryobacteraceae bacterium]
MPLFGKALSISLVPLALRRMKGVKTVSSGAVNRGIPQTEFRETIRRYQKEASAGPLDMLKVVTGLWKSEGFSTTFGKYRLPENTLNDPQIPRESLGIAHVGYGAASTEFAHFDTGKLREIFESKAHPDYRGFAYEGTGSALRIYEPGVFKTMCGILGLIPRNAPPGPDKTGFFAGFFEAFPAEIQRLITHGYGRLIAFSKISVYKAIDEAATLPEKHVYPAVQGIAFAFAMMNSQEMPRLLENSNIEYPGQIRAAFQDGLVYGLMFCEWFAPGFLAGWKSQGRLEEKLVERAQTESALNLKRGYILPFALERSMATNA